MRLGVVIPSYDLSTMAARPLLKAQQRCPFIEGDLELCEFGSSSLTGNHNAALCYARNQYKTGRWTHVLFMHSDVRPMGDDWLTTLIEIQQMAQADVLGCAIPIKCQIGLTSTAFDTDRWQPRPITLKEFKHLPPTWTHPHLLLNTGLLFLDLAKIANLDPPPRFQFHDEIFINEQGYWQNRFEPEDHNFTRQLHARNRLDPSLGLRIFVTRALEIHHHGAMTYPSAPAWGVDLLIDHPQSSGAICVTDIDGSNVWLDIPDRIKPHTNGLDTSSNGLDINPDA